MSWDKEKTWGMDTVGNEPEYVKKLHSMLDELPIEDMIAGGPQAVGTDDLVLSIRLESRTKGKFSIQVGPRADFVETYSGSLNPTWGQCHPSDPSHKDPPGSRAIWVAFLDESDAPVYLTRTITLLGMPGGDG